MNLSFGIKFLSCKDFTVSNKIPCACMLLLRRNNFFKDGKDLVFEMHFYVYISGI